MARWNKPRAWKLRRIADLIARDGPSCWLCALPVLPTARRKGRRPSIEHLVARSRGGGNRLGNLVLCHESCNRSLGDRPVERKLKMRAKWHLRARQRAAASADA